MQSSNLINASTASVFSPNGANLKPLVCEAVLFNNMMHKKIEMSGLKFGRLLVIKEAYKDNNNSWRWLCRCDCGKEIIVIGNCLRSSHTTSCGCLRIEKITKHDKCHSKNRYSEYRAWCAIKARCNNPLTKNYHHYGGRGIKICERWNKSFKNFIEDMGLKPSPQHSIDRINNNGKYDPSNCRWATIDQQNANKRTTVFYKYNGEEMMVKDWAKKIGIKLQTLQGRLRRGIPFEKAINPVLKTN